MTENLFSKISMFPYSQSSRINREEHITNKQGGILTLILMGLILSVAIIKTREMFQKTTIISKVNSQFNFDPPMITLSTHPNEQEHIPYIFAIRVYNQSTKN